MTKTWVLFAIVVLFAAVWLQQPDRACGDIISYLRFEEGSGFSTADQTGLMNGDLLEFNEFTGWSTAVPCSAIPLTGQPNTHSLYFGPGFVDLSNANDVNLGTSFTVEFYFNADVVIGGSLGFSLTPSSILTWLLAENPDTQELFYGLNLQGNTHLVSATGLTFNAWHHMAIVKEPGDFQLYLDGSLVTQQSVPSSQDGPFFFPGSNLTGDRTIGGDTGTWRGWLDEFRISDEALTPDRFLCSVPEPTTVTLLIIGCIGIYGCRRRTRQNP